ncbi:MAG: hypothetical protein HRU02_11205 [Myxococcales bacterium]|nr:hypothetical protein [Myxococcales bacterium]
MSEEMGADTAQAAAEAPADAASLPLAVLRDVALLLAALSLWAAADAWMLLSGTGFAWLLSVADGLLVGVLTAGLFHEWGHFAGARLSGGTAPLTPVTLPLPLFNFDFARSETRHFQAMGVGGNLAHWMVVLLIAIFLPPETAGRVALLAGALGFAVFASAVEFPVISRCHGGAAPIASLAGIRPADLKRNGVLGAVAALLLFSIL